MQRRKKRIRQVGCDPSVPLSDGAYADLGVMPFSEFPQHRQHAINAQCALPDPPDRWLRLELCMMPSRAFSEWHWRRGRNPAAVRESIPQPLRIAVWERDGRACRYCGAPLMLADLHVDHVHPVSRGGSDSMGNLAASCAPCNLSKGAKTLQEWSR